MTVFIYSSAGTYTDSTHNEIFLDQNNINLTNSASGAEVTVNGTGDSVVDESSGSFVYMQAYSDTIYLDNDNSTAYTDFGGDTLTMNGSGDFAVGGISSPDTITLLGSFENYIGVRSDDMITLGGSSNTVAAGSGNDTIFVNLANLGNGNKADGGAGSNTLSLTDYVGDSNALMADLGKNSLMGVNGLAIANLENLTYTISNPGTSARRTASTQFTLESGTNTLDFSYTAGSNTVYNTGGSTIVSGGSGTDTVVGGTGLTKLMSEGGTDTLYGGSGTNILQPVGGAAGTNRFYGGSGTNNFFGAGGGGTANDYMYGAGGTDYFQGGGGNNVLVEGTHSDEFHGTVGNDYIYGSSAASKVYGGANSDYVYTGASNQYFYSGTGKEYLYEEASTMTNGRLDVVDNFQTQSAGGKGTFIFEPTADANKTTFVASNGGTYIVNPAVNMASGTSDVFVANVAPSVVKAQTYFIL